jgi:apolipoprotein N-acyltransferase
MAPVYAWPLMALGYATLVYFLHNTQSWKETKTYSFLFFFGYFLTSFYWICNSLFVDFQTWWWALPFAFAGLPLLLALIPTFFLTFANFVQHYKFAAILMALVIADIVRGFIFTGFPWNYAAHTWVHHDLLMATLPVIGFYTLNALTLIIFGMLFFIPRAIAVIIIAVISVSGFWHLPHNKNPIDKNITLIQANIPQDEKWNPQYIERNFNRYIDMSTDALGIAGEPQTIIWPETAISRNLLSYAEYQNRLSEFLASLPEGSHLITGYLDVKGDDFFNSLIVLNRNGEILQTYDKHHLVPFGEYMPLGLDTITGFKGFQSGEPPKPITIADQSILPLICYEIIFPHYARQKNKSDLILNITNDAWFGHTAGPYQHFDHARFRAAETRTPVIRLSGNGMSGFIDEYGRVLQKTKLNTQDTLQF